MERFLTWRYGACSSDEALGGAQAIPHQSAALLEAERPGRLGAFPSSFSGRGCLMRSKKRPARNRSRRTQRPHQLDFKTIARRAVANSQILLPRWLPDGTRMGTEWLARNPTRPDRSLGSFKVNLKSGCWADFATGDAGGDLISLRAYLDGTSQRKAATSLAEELGL